MTIQAEKVVKRQSFSSDSLYVLRSPDAHFLEKYREDAAFDYGVTSHESLGLWDWIKQWILEHLFRMKISKGTMAMLDFLLYAVVILSVAGGLFYFWKKKGRFHIGGKKEKFFPEEVVEYNGEQDGNTFSRLLEKAEQEANYELAVRIAYSGLLQLLDEKQIIQWKSSKTNRSYVYEIKNGDWSHTFEDLSRIFDCVCYGEFSVNAEVYLTIKQYFAEFRKEVEG